MMMTVDHVFPLFVKTFRMTFKSLYFSSRKKSLEKSSCQLYSCLRVSCRPLSVFSWVYIYFTLLEINSILFASRSEGMDKYQVSCNLSEESVFQLFSPCLEESAVVPYSVSLSFSSRFLSRVNQTSSREKKRYLLITRRLSESRTQTQKALVISRYTRH